MKRMKKQFMSENRMPEEKRILRGLSKEEVEERFIEGFVNKTDISTEKSAKEIVKSNVFTYFNFIFLVITILLCVVGSFRNLTFLPIIIGNTLIGIIQELRAKKVLDKMSLLNAPHAIVIRDGEQKKILSKQLVKDDVILLTAGTQICADAVVLEGTIQVNESLLTGEADEIEKTPGSRLMSGSFVVSGECYARLEKVGKHSYISRLTAEAKAMGNEEQSEMIRSINQLVKWIGIVIIPIGIILFWQGYIVNGETFQKSIVSMVAAIIGMIPEGLYLLTTIALALGTMRLAKRHVLLHDMKSIEALARVDVLCVDKTGTITEAGMEVAKLFRRRMRKIRFFSLCFGIMRQQCRIIMLLWKQFVIIWSGRAKIRIEIVIPIPTAIKIKQRKYRPLWLPGGKHWRLCRLLLQQNTVALYLRMENIFWVRRNLSWEMPLKKLQMRLGNIRKRLSCAFDGKISGQ